MSELVILQEGAEAVIYKKTKDSVITILKHRRDKKYRIAQLNELLISKRTRREAKVLKKLSNVINVPELIFCDKISKIEMEFISGIKLRDILDNKIELAQKVGVMLAKMHDLDIIHGDLTTSNMILSEDKELFFIDFGLSQFSKRLEDKAVDIHLFKQALESKHHKIFDSAYKKFVLGYKSSLKADKVFQRLKNVENRGRNKKK